MEAQQGVRHLYAVAKINVVLSETCGQILLWFGINDCLGNIYQNCYESGVLRKEALKWVGHLSNLLNWQL